MTALVYRHAVAPTVDGARLMEDALGQPANADRTFSRSQLGVNRSDVERFAAYTPNLRDGTRIGRPDENDRSSGAHRPVTGREPSESGDFRRED
jgi:hypothetical protein